MNSIDTIRQGHVFCTVVPHLFTDHFYEPISDVQCGIITRHQQEDACELIVRLLDYDETPILYTAAKGHMDQTLHCLSFASL